jgi:hypothetical protein
LPRIDTSTSRSYPGAPVVLCSRVFVDDLDERVGGIGAGGIEAASREGCGIGVRKVVYRDSDGNEIGFGGGPFE